MGNVNEGSAKRLDSAAKRKLAILRALNAFNKRQKARVSITIRKEDDDVTPADDTEDNDDVSEDAADVTVKSSLQLQLPEMVDIGTLDEYDMHRNRNDDTNAAENDESKPEKMSEANKGHETVKNYKKVSATKKWNAF